MIVQISGGEGSQGFIVQAVWRGGSGFDDIAFVQFEFYFSGHVFLGGFHKCLQRLAKRGEPFAFVDYLSKLAAKFLLHFHGVAIQDQFFQLVMCFHQDGSARSLVYTSGFHSYHTVFHDIYNTDAMFSAQSIQLGDDFGNFHGFSVQSLRNALLKCHGHIFAFVRSFFRSYAQHQHVVIVRFIGRVFQFQSFMADVPQVSVTAVAVAGVERKIDAVFVTVFNLIFPGLHGPYVGHSPRSDDLQIRSKGFDAKLETDLVIAFSGCAVADGGSAFFSCNLYQFLCDCRACHRGAEQIFVLIDSACLYTRHNIFVAEFVDNIFNI